MRLVLILGLCAGVIFGCDDDGNNNNTTNGGSCPDLGGTWKIVQHCESSFVDDTVKVAQTDCDIIYAEPFTGWIGSVDADNNVLSTGDGGGQTLTCQGDVVGSLMTLKCSPDDCQVTMQKQ
jgi:hypothetical protein